MNLQSNGKFLRGEGHQKVPTSGPLGQLARKTEASDTAYVGSTSRPQVNSNLEAIIKNGMLHTKTPREERVKKELALLAQANAERRARRELRDNGDGTEVISSNNP